MSDMFRFWAKSYAIEGVASSHSVPHHCLDVAACAFVLARVMPPPGSVSPATVATLVALHDIGKFTRTFQAKDETLWPADVLGPLERIPGAPHDQAGYKLSSDIRNCPLGDTRN